MHQSITFLTGALALIVLSLLASGTVVARGVYQSENNFINEAFPGTPPEASRLWLHKDERKAASEIIQRKIPIRIKFWQKDDRTAWILDEIGKEKPITTGIIIRQGKIEKLKVLIFRESRGWEVRYPFFSDQFINTKLTPAQHKLNKPIDGISGATLSVRALKKLARLSLFLDQLVAEKNK